MKLVVDANIVISAIVKDSVTRKLMLHPGVELFSPDYLFDELQEHREEIMRKAKLNPEEFGQFISKLKNVIQVVPARVYGAYMEEAGKILADPDDLAYAACAIALTTNNPGIPDKDVIQTAMRDDADPDQTTIIDVQEYDIWSNDPDFYKKAGEFWNYKIKVFKTEELYELMSI